jgi:hypothetical protein
LGLSKEQLYATASYQQRDLRDIVLSGRDFRGWDFSNQDLTGADLQFAELTGADFTDAILAGVKLPESFSLPLLENSASFKNRSLPAVQMASAQLPGVDLVEFDLRNANLRVADLRGTDLSRADLRGAIIEGTTLSQAVTINTILPDGTIRGLDLQAGETLTVRNGPMPVHVEGDFRIAHDATLVIRIDEAPWQSTIEFDPSLATVAGTLVLQADPASNAAAMMGRTFRLFDWQNFAGQFDEVVSVQGHVWDLTSLYARGEVTLLGAALEIDRISSAVLAGSQDDRWDVNDDGRVDEQDRQYCIREIAETTAGDANVDGLFNSSDLVQVFRAGHYEDNRVSNSIWATGDWNGDREFTSADLVTAFQQGGYLATATSAVPEPQGLGLILSALLYTFGPGRKYVTRLLSPHPTLSPTDLAARGRGEEVEMGNVFVNRSFVFRGSRRTRRLI